jgi:hypothetical protein
MDEEVEMEANTVALALGESQGVGVFVAITDKVPGGEGV